MLRIVRTGLGLKGVLIVVKMIYNQIVKKITVKVLLSNQLRDHQKAVVEEKGSPNATTVHHTKQNDSIYYTLTTHYFQQNPMFLVLI